jgi:hypothetical protein
MSPREAETIALIARGLNQEIADVNINSATSHVRSAHREIGVERRTQAGAGRWRTLSSPIGSALSIPLYGCAELFLRAVSTTPSHARG